jgi:nucleotide-binding universal stress UspA family protein
VVFQHILVPVDFTVASDNALDFALDLARRIGAKVTVMHAYQIPTYTLVPDGAFLPSAALAASISEAAQRHLDALVQHRTTPDLTVDAHLRAGSPAEAIMEAVDQRGADLVVMGTHGGNLLERAFLGSVASKVMRLSKVPVVTVRGARTESSAAAVVQSTQD